LQPLALSSALDILFCKCRIFGYTARVEDVAWTSSVQLGSLARCLHSISQSEEVSVNFTIYDAVSSVLTRQFAQRFGRGRIAHSFEREGQLKNRHDWLSARVCAETGTLQFSEIVGSQEGRIAGRAAWKNVD
jgi:hypothetical protein